MKHWFFGFELAEQRFFVSNTIRCLYLTAIRVQCLNEINNFADVFFLLPLLKVKLMVFIISQISSRCILSGTSAAWVSSSSTNEIFSQLDLVVSVCWTTSLAAAGSVQCAGGFCQLEGVDFLIYPPRETHVTLCTGQCEEVQAPDHQVLW